MAFSFAALVSRQFVDMSRIRIEGLLAAFPKLVGSGKQHTYVETENVRYLYQPVEVRTRAVFRTSRHISAFGITIAKHGKYHWLQSVIACKMTSMTLLHCRACTSCW